MNLSRLVFALIAAGCLLRPAPLVAQGAAPFAFAKQYSSEMVITTNAGKTITTKVYMDSGKMRTEMNVHGISLVIIVRPDRTKVYQVMVDSKMVMEMPYDAEKYKKQLGAAGPDAKFELVGPDTIAGVASTKYKVTAGDGKVSFLWVDAAKQIPVKMAAEDGSYTVQWKNYQAGPQDAALFEPPADFKVMTMPGAASGGGQ